MPSFARFASPRFASLLWLGSQRIPRFTSRLERVFRSFPPSPPYTLPLDTVAASVRESSFRVSGRSHAASPSRGFFGESRCCLLGVHVPHFSSESNAQIISVYGCNYRTSIFIYFHAEIFFSFSGQPVFSLKERTESSAFLASGVLLAKSTPTICWPLLFLISRFDFVL